MPILKDLTKKLKKFTQAATAKFKEPKSTELENALQEIIVAINNFNSKVVDEENTKKFTEKIKSIFKSTCLRKYYKPGENDKVTYKRSGLTGIIFRELYIYLTKDFRQGVNTAYAPATGWLSIKDKNTLKKSFQSTYIAKFGSDEAWVESILYNEKVLTKLFYIGQRVQIGQASTPPKGQAPQPPKAEASASKPPQKPQPPIPQPPKTATSSSQPPQKPKPPMPQPPVPQPNIVEQKKIYNDLSAQRNQFLEQKNTTLYKAAKEACTAQAQYISSISANKSDYILKEEAKTATEKINAFELAKKSSSASAPPNTPPPPPIQQTAKATTSAAPATKQSNQSSPPSISDNLKRSIETIFDRLTFTEELSNTQNENLKNLKKYFKDNAKTITNNIMDLKDSENRNAWVKYFTDKPFSKKMVYNEFIDFLYHHQKNNLFTEMIKDNIVVDTKKIPEPPKVQAPQQTRVATSAHSQANRSERPLPTPNPPENTTSAPSNKQQQTNSDKTIAVANVAAAVTAAHAAAETAEEAAAKAKQLATDTSTAENAKNAAENAKNAQQAAKIVEDLAEDIAKIVNEISANDLKEYVKNANEAAEKAKEFAELAKKFAGITDDDDEYDD